MVIQIMGTFELSESRKVNAKRLPSAVNILHDQGNQELLQDWVLSFVLE
jgi:hypothetical protein